MKVILSIKPYYAEKILNGEKTYELRKSIFKVPNIKTVISRENAKDTSWNRNVLAMKLISDFQFATKNAIDELTYWQKVHNNDWTKVWSSYNAGWKYDSNEAKRYSKDIALIIRELKKVNV